MPRQYYSRDTFYDYHGNVFTLNYPPNEWSFSRFLITGIRVQKDTVTLPDVYNTTPITELSLDSNDSYPQVKHLILSEKLQTLSISNKNFPNLEKVTVPEKGVFTSDGKCIYSRSKNILLYTFCNQPAESFTVPASVTILASSAFRYTKCKEIIFENPNVEIQRGCFDYSDFFTSHDPVMVGSTLYRVRGKMEELEIKKGTRIHPIAFQQHCPRRLRCDFLPPHDLIFPKENENGEKELDDLILTGPPAEINPLEIRKYVYLRSVVIEGEHPRYETVDGVLFDRQQKALLFYPRHKKAKEYTVPEGTKSIGKNAFRGVQALKTLTLPDSVEYIGEHSLCYLKSLESLRLSDSLRVIPSPTSLGEGGIGTVSNNYKLSQVHLPQSLTAVGTDAFYRTDIAQLSLPEGVISLHNFAFATEKLEAVTLPKSLAIAGRGSLYPAKEVTAYEGTAAGLVNAVNPYSEKDASSYRFTWHECRIRILSAKDSSFLGTLFIPESIKASSAGLLCDAWNAPTIDYASYAAALEDTKTLAEKLEMAVILCLKGGMQDTYLPYLKRNGIKTFTRLVETNQLEYFIGLLDAGILSKPSGRKLLDTCNSLGRTEFIPYLMDYLEGRTKRHTSSRFSL